MDEKAKSFLSGFCGILATLSENYGMILTLCCAFILIDLATGLGQSQNPGEDQQRYWLQRLLAKNCHAFGFGIRYLSGRPDRLYRRPWHHFHYHQFSCWPTFGSLHSNQRMHFHPGKSWCLRGKATEVHFSSS